MFNDTVTVFNYIEDKKKGIYEWYVSVIHKVETQISKGQNVMKSGNENADTLYLSIPLTISNNKMFADGIEYCKPNAFKTLESKENTFTLGEKDFIAIGDYSNMSGNVVNENDYPGGLFEYMKKTYDDVYNINSVDIFKGIPHIEVGGK